MIPKQAAELYSHIHAPDGLMNKILERVDQPQKKRYLWKQTFSAAACLLLIIFSMAYFRPGNVEVSLYGTIVEESPVAVSVAAPMHTRSIVASEFLEIPLEISYDVSASVSHGTIEKLEPHVLVWKVSAKEIANSKATLTLTTRNKNIKYSLFADSSKLWYLEKVK